MIIIYLQITLENPNFYLTEKMVCLKITIFFLTSLAGQIGQMANGQPWPNFG